MDNKSAIYNDAQHYDLMFGDPPHNFWRKIAELYGDPILELGCGTGKISIPLAKAGYEILGIDNSKTMLDYASYKSEQEEVNIQWSLMNMTHFDLDQRFKLVILPSNNIGHLHTLDEVDGCFASIRRHLEPDGVFVIDMFVPSRMASGDERHEVLAEYNAPDGSGTCKLTGMNTYEPDTQINRCKTCHKVPNKPDVYGSLDLKMYYPQELYALLIHNGFQVAEQYGNYRMNPFNSQSRRQIYIAKLASDQQIGR